VTAMKVIVNHPCGHPLIAVEDKHADSLAAALSIFHDLAGQPQTVLIDMDEDAVSAPQGLCMGCLQAMGAYLLAAGRKRVLADAEENDVSGFAAVKLLELMSCHDEDFGASMNPLRASQAIRVVIRAGWRLTHADPPVPDDVDPQVAWTDPRITGR
jgi:hypothetical protein